LRDISVICEPQTPAEIAAFTEADYVANGTLIREAKITL